MHGRPFALPGVKMGCSEEGDAMVLELPPHATVTMVMPNDASPDGVGSRLRLQSASLSIRRMVLAANAGMYGLGDVSNAAIRAFVHEVSARWRVSPDDWLALLTGRRGELTPIADLVRATESAQQSLGVPFDALPEPWTGTVMPFMTPEGLMTTGGLAIGAMMPAHNRALVLVTDAVVSRPALEAVATVTAKPFLAWLSAMGVASGADCIVLVATALRRDLVVTRSSDPMVPLLSEAFGTVLARLVEPWARSVGADFRVRVTGLLDGGEAVRVTAALTTTLGRWRRLLSSGADLREASLDAIRRIGLVNYTESDVQMRLGEVLLERRTSTKVSSSASSELTIHLGRGVVSTTFAV